MKVIAETDQYTIFQKRNQRYGVRRADRAWINGEEKVSILLEHKLIEAAAPKPAAPEAAAAEDAAAEEAAPATEEPENKAD